MLRHNRLVNTLMMKMEWNKMWLPTALALAPLSFAFPIYAQTSASSPLPSSSQPGAAELKNALRRIGRNRNDVNALIDAGNATLMLGDAPAAINFFRRAESIRPSDGRVKAGIGAALVRQENPFEALRYFDTAARMGVSQRVVALDRGLAYDLLGNFDRAQQDYVLAATQRRSDLLTIRHAISLSLSGKKAESDQMLTPLLNKNSPAAWRARAFMLAARGDFRDSREVTRGFLNPQAARRVEPFLKRMPDLTAAQQAAAIHLGHFPARNIGRDNPKIKIASSSQPSAVPASGSDRLTPAGRQLGSGSREGATAAPSLAQQLIAEAALASASVKASAPAISPPARPATAFANASQPSTSPATPLPTAIMPRAIAPVIPATSQAVLATQAVPMPSTPVKAVVAQSAPAQAVAANTALTNTTPAPALPKTASATNAAGFDSLASVTPLKSAIVPSSSPVAVSQPALPAKTAPAVASAAVSSPVTSPISAPINAAPAPTPAPAAKTPAIVFKPTPQSSSQPVPKVPTITETATGTVASVTAKADSASAVPAQQTSASPADSFDLGDIVESIDIPQSEKQSSVKPADLNALPKPAPKPAPMPAPKPAAAPKPAVKAAAVDENVSTTPRYWVQIATGPTSALKGEYRRLSRKYPELYKGQEGWSSPWNNTGRLVVGPFDGFTAAKEWYQALKDAGGDGFVWNSAKGTEVTRLNRK